MEFLSHLFSSVVLSVSAFLGVDAPPPQVVQTSSETRAEQRVDAEEDEALNSALTELRGIQQRVKQPEVIEGMPVQYPKRKPDPVQKQQVQTPVQQPQLPPKTELLPSFVLPATPQKNDSLQPTSSSPLASSTAVQEAVGAIMLKPLPHQNIESAYREAPAAIGSQYELRWDIPSTLTCSIIVYRYKNTDQVSSLWMKVVEGVGNRKTDPLYQDQRYRLLCKDTKGIYHADTVLFRTRSTVKTLPTCAIGASKASVQSGETVRFTIYASDVETFAFGNTRPVVPESALVFPFTQDVVLTKGQQPFTVTVGNRLGTTTCNATVKIE